ncbi:hypothetical protein SETIT_4G013600v2 [Setaria italica]|uniref:DUF4220 domain-containing protein n=1 Tax=Setaria italica TaxID=4555 RepID=A0A368QQ12_SETIT|nr:uncharacterized protein LOC101770414 [Setaria italica]RCV19904.1 hypothetical protein SETIT_4G013600v2 [Setaria italica]
MVASIPENPQACRTMGLPSCQVVEINSYIGNLTSSYTEKSNELSMVAASVIMFVLVGLFFNLNLFSGISDISAILDPKVRLVLTSALSLFLPVMSYLFSEAKNTGHLQSSTTAGSTQVADLPLRAGLILAWMLLVELLRKKVDEIRMRGFSGTIQRAGRVVWLGSLVFFNIESAGRKAVFSILWILCATKVLQRIAFTEVGKRSYAHGKNARLISSYMSQMLEWEPPQDAHLQQEDDNDTLIKTCNYIVMGEEKLVDIEPTADGYKLGKAKSPGYDSIVKLLEENDSIITVRKVWELDDKDKFFSLQQIQSLKRICLSFALFKLLRRRFEHLPAVTKEEARNSQNLILKGLYNKGQTSSSAEAVFQVLNDEVNFLSEYYHSVVPVVLASPFFLFINYFLVNIVVAFLCFMTVILCGNGDVRYALHSLGADNYTLQYGVGNIAICLLLKATSSPSAFFSIVDLSITILLFIIFFYEEIWEFFVFLLSNWFMVSLVYNYIAKPSWLKRSTFRGALYWGGFSIIMWLRTKMSHADLRMKQFSVLNLRWPPKLPLFATFTSMAVKTVVVPSSVKESIMKYLANQHDDPQANPLTNGMSTLHNRNNNLYCQDLSWACRSNSVAEVILTWHIATSIMEVKCDTPQNGEDISRRKVAFRLSKYCAYLVAFHPELLPDNPEKVECVFEDMKAELKAMLGCQDYYLSSQHKRVQKIMDEKTTPLRQNQPSSTAGQSDTDKIKVAQDGVNLARSLMTKTNKWQVLADVWTEIIIYLAPSSDEERVKGHEEALVQGGEFITVLWALTTHIGISRPSKSEINVGHSAA